MQKSADAFRTISEVSDLLDLPAHVLRFWESRFTQIKPVKRAGGRRYYRPGDVALLRGIRRLLYDDGLTIRGVQKILREKGVAHVAALVAAPDESYAPPQRPEAGDARPAEADHWIAVPEPVIAAGDLELIPDPDDTAPPAPKAAPPVPHWSPAPLPDPAPHNLSLVPDPDDEAPMLVDVPPLPPQPGSGIVTALDRSRVAARGGSAPARPAPQSAGAEEPDFPAARLLRAMDSLRAQGSRAELAAIHARIERLHDRMTRAADAARD